MEAFSSLSVEARLGIQEGATEGCVYDFGVDRQDKLEFLTVLAHPKLQNTEW